MIVREKLVVGYCEFISMESGAEFLAPQDTSIVTVAEERWAGNKKRIQWWSQANWPRLKEDLVNSWDPSLRGQCDEYVLELNLDPVS